MIDEKPTYFASGKLMFFGEYLVLCGSKSLAVPLQKGQTLTIESNNSGIIWESYVNNQRWFDAEFHENLSIMKSSNHEIAERLQNILRTIKSIGTEVDFSGHFRMNADFNLNWGFGSSSTLISCLSQWSGVGAQELLSRTFGGSGYDVACSTVQNPIVYSVNKPLENVELNPAITDKILFVYLGNKQNSQKEVGKFKEENVSDSDVKIMNSIIDKTIQAESIEEFEHQMNESEDLLSKVLNRSKIKELFFVDYPYSIKSMGAWGGDFFMATYRSLIEAKKYFSTLGYDTMFTYHEIVKTKL